MEIKKSPKANLEKGKGLSFLLGLVLALSVLYVFLELRSYDKAEAMENDKLNIADIEDTLIVEDPQEEEKQPEPEETKVQEVQLPEEFKVVDNEQKVEKISLVSADENRKLPPPAPVITAPVKEEDDENKVFMIVEQQPEFPGGTAALMKWLSSNVRYPEIAIENNIQGRVIVSFVVEKDGSTTDVKVVRGVDPALDKEAVRLASSMPKWTPGKQRGKPVRTRFTLPVAFQLRN
ncbi:energy transducer TonB [Porphyromonas crevioricanis]|uniref:Energy transducer TonB n=2 Tax=Porphyromonas crevioricanis TaxID=393921 RepID=A0A0A2FV92_9PORP|nr:energy transducer TonB [Porphyromonas crevioricanis]KGN90955.1 energy transducer TonB [Porphyromonas crevioricanis]KGN95051.1 energy transducer TonB [Porphyromonas crevioricanis]SJZ54305.1 outer membrane transport energization protein TonB (TC 2.C.1.1.1) [Porphyromonas crevioricanis]SQH73281.1 TonB family C-terminal domain [Porphyromonas crevioricanis]GAD06266.1 ferric siderophore transport system, periplasmic binding protein TonB [Porphyromonas crevioricanis JCM 15906]